MLGHDQGHVDRLGLIDGLEDGVLVISLKHDALDLLLRQLKGLLQVPADGFSFAVLIRCEPDHLSGLRQFLELTEPPFVCGQLIGGHETIFHIHSELAAGQVSDVAITGAHNVVATEITFNGLGLGGGLYYNEVLTHVLFCSKRQRKRQTCDFRCGKGLLVMLPFCFVLLRRRRWKIWQAMTDTLSGFGLILSPP